MYMYQSNSDFFYFRQERCLKLGVYYTLYAPGNFVIAFDLAKGSCFHVSQL